jgi:hypothetical protein
MSAGCIQESKDDHLRDKIDPIAEKLFEGISEGNYTKFSEDFTPVARKALPEDKFYEFYYFILSNVGKPTSAEFLEAFEGERYITATYALTFEDGSEGFITIAMVEENKKLKVAGLWINSPLLRAKMEQDRIMRHP